MNLISAIVLGLLIVSAFVGGFIAEGMGDE